MCGVLGICFNKGHLVSGKEHQITLLLKSLFKETEVRGRVATGIAAMTNKRLLYMKKKTPARSFIEAKEFENFMKEVLLLDRNKDEYLYSIIGHCRLDTKGTPDDNVNNHPIVTENIVGIHNGNISNDEELYERFLKAGIKRKGRVDSEVIFQLVDLMYNKYLILDKTEENPTAKAIKSVCRRLKGYYVCAMMNKNEPDRLYLFRDTNNSLTVAYLKKQGIVTFCSSKRAMERSFYDSFGYSMSDKYAEEIHTEQDTVLTIDMEENLLKNEISYEKATHSV